MDLAVLARTEQVTIGRADDEVNVVVRPSRRAQFGHTELPHVGRGPADHLTAELGLTVGIEDEDPELVVELMGDLHRQRCGDGTYESQWREVLDVGTVDQHRDHGRCQDRRWCQRDHAGAKRPEMADPIAEMGADIEAQRPRADELGIKGAGAPALQRVAIIDHGRARNAVPAPQRLRRGTRLADR